MPPDAQKRGPKAACGGATGRRGIIEEHSLSLLDTQAQKLEWWTPELQRALDILADPIYHGLQIQITGQAGCGYHPLTTDPAELKRFAQEVGLDATYSVCSNNGRVSFPVAIGEHTPSTISPPRAARPIKVKKRRA